MLRIAIPEHSSAPNDSQTRECTLYSNEPPGQVSSDEPEQVFSQHF